MKKAKITEAEKSAALARIEPVTDIAALKEADFAVEAVPENLDLKVRVLKSADEVLRPGVTLASNTSSISITTLAAQTSRPDKFIGMHFMNPVPVMVLVEVIRGLQTSDDTFAQTMQLCEKLGKKPVAVNDAPGFVSNRVLMPLINEAAFACLLYTSFEGLLRFRELLLILLELRRARRVRRAAVRRGVHGKDQACRNSYKHECLSLIHI